MQSRRTYYSEPQSTIQEEDDDNYYAGPYSSTKRAVTYPPYKSRRSSRTSDSAFSASDRTLVGDANPVVEDTPWRSNATMTERRDVVRPRRHSQSTTTPKRRDSLAGGNDSTTPATDVVYIERLTISAHGPPLDTHLRNTKGNVHIKHVRIEDETALAFSRNMRSMRGQSSQRSSSGDDERKRRRRRSRADEKETEKESVSKLTRVCELATVAALLLQWKEYKQNK